MGGRYYYLETQLSKLPVGTRVQLLLKDLHQLHPSSMDVWLMKTSDTTEGYCRLGDNRNKLSYEFPSDMKVKARIEKGTRPLRP